MEQWFDKVLPEHISSALLYFTIVGTVFLVLRFFVKRQRLAQLKMKLEAELAAKKLDMERERREQEAARAAKAAEEEAIAARAMLRMSVEDLREKGIVLERGAPIEQLQPRRKRPPTVKESCEALKKAAQEWEADASLDLAVGCPACHQPRHPDKPCGYCGCVTEEDDELENSQDDRVPAGRDRCAWCKVNEATCGAACEECCDRMEGRNPRPQVGDTKKEDGALMAWNGSEWATITEDKTAWTPTKLGAPKPTGEFGECSVCGMFHGKEQLCRVQVPPPGDLRPPNYCGGGSTPQMTDPGW